MVEEAAPRDGGAMRGHVAGVAAISHRECLLQERVDSLGPRGPRIIAGELTTPAKEVGHAGLMRRVSEAPIRGPAITHQHTVEIGPEDRRGLRKATAGLDRETITEGVAKAHSHCNRPATFQ